MTVNAPTFASEHSRRLDIYEVASQAYLRAMSNDASLTVTYGSNELLDDSVVVVPRLESVDDKRLLALHRGLLDSYVFMRQYHDADVHNQNAPADAISVRLFNLLERERFEALGGEHYFGSRLNLAALWAGSYTPELIERLAGVEQLEWIISFLWREQLNVARAPDYIATRIESLRGPVEALIGVHLLEMAMVRFDQKHYAQEVLRLINRLGFPIDRAQPESVDTATSDGTATDNAPLDSHAALVDETDDDAHASAGVEPTPSDSPDEDQAALIRNADHENLLEPSQSELEQLPETDAPQVSLHDKNGSVINAYTVYDRTSDEEVSALALVIPVELKSLKSALDQCVAQHAHLVRQLAARLQRHLMARQQRAWLDEQDEGELDTRRLPRLIIDPSTPVSYRIETESPVRSTTVTILVDNSRSMLGRPIELAAVCTELLTRTLERCGVTSEVLGFTTVSMYGGSSKAHWQSAGEISNPGRLNSVRHIIYKSAQMPWRRARERFAVMLKPDVLKQNIDGEALQWAHERLLKRTEDKRLLIVISDGAPSDAATLTANSKDLLVKHLRAVVNDIEKRSPVELMAIGIGHDVSEHYANAMMINDADELGSALLHHLTRMMIDSDSRLVA